MAGNPYGLRFTGDPTMAFSGPRYTPDNVEIGPLPKVSIPEGTRLPTWPINPPLGPLAAPSLDEAEALSEEIDANNPMVRQLARIGASMGDVRKVYPDAEGGYMAYGQTGNAKPVSSTTRFGTATFAPGTFVIGGADPERREFLTQRGIRDAAQSRRELSNFMSVNAPTGLRDNYGTADPMLEARVRAGRAEAAAKENALNPLPDITVDDPYEVRRAGGQAAYNAQKLAEAKYAAAASPSGREALDLETAAKAKIGAAPYAMGVDAGSDARSAFLKFMFGELKAQGATPQDIAQIAALAKVSPEEVQKILAETGVR